MTGITPRCMRRGCLGLGRTLPRMWTATYSYGIRTDSVGPRRVSRRHLVRSSGIRSIRFSWSADLPTWARGSAASYRPPADA